MFLKITVLFCTGDEVSRYESSLHKSEIEAFILNSFASVHFPESNLIHFVLDSFQCSDDKNQSLILTGSFESFLSLLTAIANFGVVQEKNGLYLPNFLLPAPILKFQSNYFVYDSPVKTGLVTGLFSSSETQ